MSAYTERLKKIELEPKTWLITGAAGFIGSHICQKLLSCGQKVRAVDNFSTGKIENIEEIKKDLNEKQLNNFEFIEGDISSVDLCRDIVKGIDLVSHQAALGSVPRSFVDPYSSIKSNVLGFISLAEAASKAGISRFVYASSSSVYGDSSDKPKREGGEGTVLSPYALSKEINEETARLFKDYWDVEIVGLRYFNVFGPRQNPDGPYAAVIPRWLEALKSREPCKIFGDGETSRDFCYIENAVQANILAATSDNKNLNGEVFNISCGDESTLNFLFQKITEFLGLENTKAQYEDFRIGDVKHSMADISKAKEVLAYQPSHSLEQGLREMLS